MKAIIIDDEFIVLEGMKRMIDWSKFGIEIVGTADNGEEGFRLYEKYQPEIVFTDIRMPGKDGLTLIKEILDRSPETLCVVFSGFNEFEYVRNALKLGVIDYLEKPITIPMINETLQKILEQKDKQKNANEHKKMKLEKMTMDLLMQNQGSIENWFCEFEYAKKISGFMVIVHDSPSFSLDSNSDYLSVSITVGFNYINVIYLYTPNPSNVLQILKEKKRDGGIYSAGNMYVEIDRLYTSYMEALRAYKLGLIQDKEGIILFDEINQNNHWKSCITEQEKQIVYNMKLGNQEQVYRLLTNYFTSLEEDLDEIRIIAKRLQKLLYLCIDIFENPEYALSEPLPFFSHSEFRKLNTKEELKSWLFSTFDWILDFHEKSQLVHKYPVIEEARKYIHLHYNESISIQEIADEVGLNPNYFSVLFKEAVGMTYIKYLTQLRIDVAKLMLRQGNTVSNVSHDVGYMTYRYFSEIFKKYTGVSPGKYKKESSL
ncbi:response regulator [Oceanobacillus sp. FSL W7-1293]|uniref:response regulator transcription factor n=1 Tax=Oceanobacillus sp. FSL W7-1293 TaxID=2921699 RepID=UPI0030CA95B0